MFTFIISRRGPGSQLLPTDKECYERNAETIELGNLTWSGLWILGNLTRSRLWTLHWGIPREHFWTWLWLGFGCEHWRTQLCFNCEHWTLGSLARFPLWTAATLFAFPSYHSRSIIMGTGVFLFVIVCSSISLFLVPFYHPGPWKRSLISVGYGHSSKITFKSWLRCVFGKAINLNWTQFRCFRFLAGAAQFRC